MKRRLLRTNITGVRVEALIHLCEHAGCTRWGPFGFGVFLRRHPPEPGVWFCRAHKADGEVGEARAA